MIVTRSRRVEKVLKKIAKSGRNDCLLAFKKAVDLLEVHNKQAQDMLHKRFRDHALTGHMRGKRELHLSQDDLLIYRIHEPNIIELLDITTHEGLRKRK